MSEANTNPAVTDAPATGAPATGVPAAGVPAADVPAAVPAEDAAAPSPFAADTDPAIGAGTAAGRGPRTRWAAIVWGLLFAALAGGALFIVLSPERRIALLDWIVGLEPTTLALYGALAIGALVLLASLVGLLRRAQRALAARRS